MGGESAGGSMGWLVWALAAAALSAVMSVLTKAGLKDVDQGVGLAIQTTVTVALAWVLVLMRGKASELAGMGWQPWAFLAGAGLAISLAYVCLFRALKLGDASAVSPIDKLSLVFAVALAAVFLGEKLTWPTGIGAALMAAGAVVIAVGKGSR